jgi:OmpA family
MTTRSDPSRNAVLFASQCDTRERHAVAETTQTEVSSIMKRCLISTAILLAAMPFTARTTSVDLYGVNFKLGHPIQNEDLASALAGENEFKKLDENVRLLKYAPKLTFEVVGHTDHYECDGQECNDLALRRAQLVYAYVLDAGIDAHRIKALREFGSTRHIAATPEMREINARVEMNVME